MPPAVAAPEQEAEPVAQELDLEISDVAQATARPVPPECARPPVVRLRSLSIRLRALVAIEVSSDAGDSNRSPPSRPQGGDGTLHVRSARERVVYEEYRHVRTW